VSVRRYTFNRRNPQPRAICDRCGFEVERPELREQLEFRGGDAPVGIGVLVCSDCYDAPQPFYARPLVKNDPTPVRNPRPPQTILVSDNDNLELREDGSIELREDDFYELREVDAVELREDESNELREDGGLELRN